MHQGVCLPTKGSSRAIKSRYSATKIDKFFGLLLYVFDPNQFKDFIAGRLTVPVGDPGSWNVYHGCDRRYADMICAEQKKEIKDKKGRVTYEWQPISSHAQNHMLDVEVNCALAAEIAGVRYLIEPEVVTGMLGDTKSANQKKQLAKEVMKLQLWLVQFVGGFWDVRQQKYTKSEFEFTGVFDSKEKAISACRDSDYLVTPITPNRRCHTKV